MTAKPVELNLCQNHGTTGADLADLVSLLEPWTRTYFARHTEGQCRCDHCGTPINGPFWEVEAFT